MTCQSEALPGTACPHPHLPQESHWAARPWDSILSCQSPLIIGSIDPISLSHERRWRARNQATEVGDLVGGVHFDRQLIPRRRQAADGCWEDTEVG